jgi:hypothetical protein
MVEEDRPQITIWHMRIACWVTKMTDTLRLCIHIAFPWQHYLCEHTSVLRYTLPVFSFDLWL